jgi:hypothetical protein
MVGLEYSSHPYSLSSVLGSEPARAAQPIPQSAAALAGGCGTRAPILAAEVVGRYDADSEHAPFRYELPTRSWRRLNVDFRAKRRALTADEPLQMMSREDSFYKDFALVKVACRRLSRVLF